MDTDTLSAEQYSGKAKGCQSKESLGRMSGRMGEWESRGMDEWGERQKRRASKSDTRVVNGAFGKHCSNASCLNTQTLQHQNTLNLILARGL